MHTLTTTNAFVLGSAPRGENSKVYKLYTSELGLIYAHGQGVREVKNRNRFGLATGTHSRVTLVRGRDTWRITGAQSLETELSHLNQTQRAYMRKLFTLLASLAPQDVAHAGIYRHLEHIRDAVLVCSKEELRDVEMLGALRLLCALGHLSARDPQVWPHDACTDTPITQELIAWAHDHRRSLLAHINGGIRSAHV